MNSITHSNITDTLRACDSFLKKTGFRCLLTLNPEIIVKARQNPRLQEVLRLADIRIADGIGLVATERLKFRKRLKRVPGIDLITAILATNRHTVYLVGSKKAVLENATTQIRLRYPGTQVVGTHHGYFELDQSKTLIAAIKAARPDYVIVGMGCPKQELFLRQLQQELDYGIGIGAGGSFDVISGSIKRAPLLLQKLGLEWVWRGLMDPKRMVVRWPNLVKFLWISLRQTP